MIRLDISVTIIACDTRIWRCERAMRTMCRGFPWRAAADRPDLVHPYAYNIMLVHFTTSRLRHLIPPMDA